MAPTDDEKLAQLQAITGVSLDTARDYLEAFNGDTDAAAQALLEDDDAGAEPDQPDQPASPQVPADYTGPRTLDGRPVPEAARGAAKKSAKGKSQQKSTARGVGGVATLSSLGGGGGHSHGSGDDSDDEDPSGRGDLFAGGEKSGLAVRDPTRDESRGEGARRMINDIVSKAKEQSRRLGTGDDDAEDVPARTWGRGQTLGGEGVESRTIGGPSAASHQHDEEEGEAQERTIHLWHDGFSFEGGPLYRFDDPNNADTLALIRSGRAPLHLMNVQLGQPVNARIAQHDEPYRQLPQAYRPFGGEGRRLGSPVPGDGSAMPPPPTSQPAAPSPAAAASTGDAPNTGVNTSQPTLSLRIQLPDGTRLPARFNTTQTIGDIYEFVTRAHPATRSRPFVIATTFPNKDHTEHGLELGEMPEFKKGGTAVVKWT